MENKHVVIGNTEDEIWEQLTKDLVDDEWAYEYKPILKQGKREVLLDIDIDLGGGFEGGYESTLLSAVLHGRKEDFSFAIHHEGFLDEIGKFLGMQDIETGYAGFDEKVIVKSNNEEKVKQLFSDSEVRSVFESLTGFSFGITSEHISHSNERQYSLEFSCDSAITNATELRKIYHAFVVIFDQLEA